MKIKLTTLLLLGALTLTFTANAQERGDASAALETIAALDVARYMGTWYEIAKYPNRFQRKCAKDTRADYQLAEAGQVTVTNRCRTADGETIEAMGLARQIGPATSPKLQVRFAPAWLSFLSFVWGNYWVIDLDEAYQLVAISEPGRDYLWILARTPTVEAAAYDALLARLAARGFDLKRLERSQPD
ncbi:lipocalin family protein [Dechloromonas sp.]|uniref:lipocalin family protein n=1 Tax=Dechloromonas sp. TaxID=1917218 RepID=UPI00122245FD|nr:lipocalin family protein [Dechloromonas sp.]MBU3698112.1 lipocalin family protein [Dechloromonas sp.]TEX48574.1 MAG: lipocalin [Rhodocyclaceae bacterium]